MVVLWRKCTMGNNKENWTLPDKEKLEMILKSSGISRSDLARALEVNYTAVYRWLDRGIRPHPRQAHDIDALFKDLVDLRPVVLKLKKEIGNPIDILKKSTKIKEKF